MYLSAVIFVIGCAVYAAYSMYSIRGLCHTWMWHLLQWTACLLFVGAGFSFGLWWHGGFDFHNFGNIMAAAAPGVTVYIIVLRLLQHGMK